MLSCKNLAEKMLKHIPRWLDIRKRVHNSNGGQLITSIAEETALLQEAIDDYKKDFFIDSYFGKEEDIVDFTYRFQIGDILSQDFYLRKPSDFVIATSIKDFYSTSNTYYYEEGYLYFKPKDFSVPQQDIKIEYVVNGRIYSSTVEIYHVWNIFDEFATFVGIERHEMETNKELENRILDVFKNPFNSSDIGLRNVIKNELMNYIDISDEEIKIEAPTPENLRKKYDEFNKVIDIMSSINKDTYKEKRWSLDKWYYSIDSIDYIPHAFDVIINEYQDGIGFKDDLAVTLSKANDTTSLQYYAYNKSTRKLDNYLRSTNKKIDINLNLIKYSNELTPINAEYKITAAEAFDITNSNISFSYASIDNIKDDVNVCEYVKIVDGVEDIYGIGIDDNTRLENGRKYAVEFFSKEEYAPTIIEKCYVIEDQERKNLLGNNMNNFYKKGDKYISNNCIKYIDTVNAFESTENLIDINNGISLPSFVSSGNANINLYGLNNKKYYLKYGCPMAPIPTDNINLPNSYMLSQDGQSIICMPNHTLDTLYFSINANRVSFNVYGSARISIKENGKIIFKDDVTDDEVKTKLNMTDSYMEIEITSLDSTNGIIINNLKYCCFKIIERVDFGTITTLEDGSKVTPNISNNSLTIEINTAFENSPYIEYIYFGEKNSSDRLLLTEPFTANNNSKIYFSTKNIRANLICYNNDMSINTDKSIYNFIPKIEYVSSTDDAYIILDFSKFINISKVQSNIGTLSIPNKNVKEYKLLLKKGQKISNIFINGDKEYNKKKINLNTLLGISPSKKDKVYITSICNDFIVEKNGKRSKVNLKDIEELNNVFSTGIFKFEGLDDNFVGCYVTDANEKDSSLVISSSSYIGRIFGACIKPKTPKTHIAYNKQQLITPSKNNVLIQQNFTPFLEEGKLYYYLLENSSYQATSYFELTNDNWSLGESTIFISAIIDLFNSDNYLISSEPYKLSAKLNRTISLDNLTDSEDTLIDFRQFIIQCPDGMEIKYISPNTSVDTIETKPNMFSSETFYKENDGYNKLEYCNVDNIIEIKVSGTENNLREGEDFEIIKDSGIIVWLNNNYSGNEIDIIYSIKVPTNLIISDEILYDKINNEISTYELFKTSNVFVDLNDNSFLDLSYDEDFKNADRITIKCLNPNYEAYKENNGIRVKQKVKEDVLYMKSGYYYVDNKEYFKFSEIEKDNVNKDGEFKYENIYVDDDIIYTQMERKNHLKNTNFNLLHTGEIYHRDFYKKLEVQGISALGSITACNTFNHWNTVGMNINFATGLNDIAIEFSKFLNNGYAYLEITDYIANFKEVGVNLYSSKNVNVYIARATIEANGMMLPYKVISDTKTSSIKECNFTNEKDTYKYYLLVLGNTVLDDIIIYDYKHTIKSLDVHKKNIDVLGLDINEQVDDAYISRIFLLESDGYKGYGAEKDYYGYVRNSSMINYDTTKIKEYQNREDFSVCTLGRLDVENNIIVSKANSGVFISDAIYIEDKDILKTLTIKVNELSSTTNGFKTSLITCSNINGDFVPIHSQTGGYIHITDLSNVKAYIKIKVEVPENSFINRISLYGEYKTTDEKAPIETIHGNGYVISEIYDARFEKNYILDRIDILDIDSIQNVKIEVRAAKQNIKEYVFGSWRTIVLDNDYNIVNKNELEFEASRLFQFRITIKLENSFVKIRFIDLKTKTT